MSLINSSYFTGARDIPNTSYPETAAMVDNLVSIHERDLLIKLLGYELFKNFWAGIASLTPEQRIVDILLGTDFTGMDGRLKRWDGLVSITDQLVNMTVSLSGANDIFFTVGTIGAPVDGDDSYINTDLAGLDIRVTQRGFGPLEILDADSVNAVTADIELLPAGGFKWRGLTRFDNGDKYQVQLFSTTLDVSSYAPVTVPVSLIADYVYYWYLRNSVNRAAASGQVQSENENSMVVSSKHQQAAAYNAMVDKACVLKEFLQVNYTVYPEFQAYAGSRELWGLLKKINAYNF